MARLHTQALCRESLFYPKARSITSLNHTRQTWSPRAFAMLLATSIATLVLATLGGGCAHPYAGSKTAIMGHPIDRMQIPKAGPAPQFNAPKAKVQTLPNGLTTMLVHKPGLPLSYLQITLAAGSATDPSEQSGLAGLTAALLKSGSKKRGAQEISDAIATLGASFSVAVGRDATHITLKALTSNFDAALAIVADALLNARFSKQELDRVRDLRLAELKHAQNDPSHMASKIFAKTLFGDHPYGHLPAGDAKSLARIQQEDVARFAQEHFLPSISAAIMVSDLSDAAQALLLQHHLGAWNSKTKKGQSSQTKKVATKVTIESPEIKAAVLPQIILANKAKAPQSQLRIGHIGVARNHPDHMALLLANATLGGLFNSRINLNLREDKGYTYGAYSRFDFRKNPGPFVVSTGVKTDTTAAAIQEILKEISLFKKSGVLDEELVHAKNRYARSLAGNFQTVEKIASMMAKIFLFELPYDYYQELPKKIEAVSPEDVLRAAQTHLKPSSLQIVVVGDAKAVQDELEQLGRGSVVRQDPPNPKS